MDLYLSSTILSYILRNHQKGGGLKKLWVGGWGVGSDYVTVIIISPKTSQLILLPMQW